MPRPSGASIEALERALERALAQVSAETQPTEPSVIARVGEVLLGASLQEIKAALKAEVKQELTDVVKAAVREEFSETTEVYFKNGDKVK